ncbi:trypsin delta-like [Lutzomyia longipalpis]|uniref:trypsin delta-like n=1 Tax=Lutzomyia longipalpis TaxID=7200 RepID=UPI0024842A82|nr:trypsin delta-like [Lutzomyia longipalpis]
MVSVKGSVVLLTLLSTVLANPLTNQPGTTFIVGGSNADISDFPWQLSLQMRGGGRHFCGGSIISPSWAITAAHCLEHFTPEMIKVLAGSTNVNNIGGKFYEIERFVMHPEYNEDTFSNNDIAVFKIHGEYDGINMRSIQMGDVEPTAGSTVTISGWGNLAWLGNMPDILQAVHVPVVDRNVCNLSYNGGVNENMFCAGKPGRDACQGDSGGAVVQHGRLVGIVSFGYQCALENYPGVNTNIASPSIRNFIQSAIRD